LRSFGGLRIAIAREKKRKLDKLSETVPRDNRENIRFRSWPQHQRGLRDRHKYPACFSATRGCNLHITSGAVLM
jgi:hypothetical protein